MPRFAVLLHRTPSGYRRPTHHDLLLEASEGCRTWALAAEPTGREPIEAEQLPEHRLVYLEYQGPISGDRGEVARVDAGSFEWISDSALRVQIRIEGKRLAGTIELKRVAVESSWWEYRYIPTSPPTNASEYEL